MSKKLKTVGLQFIAHAHFHTVVEMDEETFKEFESLGEDTMVSESTRPNLFALMHKAASNHDAFDHIEHDSDLEEIQVIELHNYPFGHD